MIMPSKSHGATGTRLYQAWENMRARCNRKSSREYENYGGRGISVCSEWNEHFESFRDWALNNGYSEQLTLDRIDVNGNYEPGNCRWISNKEQQNNKRNNRNITYNGRTQTLNQWAKELGMIPKTLQGRLDKSGWSIEKALTTPVMESNLVDLTGRRFGRLRVLSLEHTRHGAHWRCSCDCGQETIVRGYHLTSGLTQSCGCLNKESSVTVGKNLGKLRSQKSREIQVIQLDKNMNEVGRFNGFLEASERTGINKGNINRAARGKFRNIAGGFYWKVVNKK